MYWLILPVLSTLLLAAHYSRHNETGLMLLCILLPPLLFVRKRWILHVFKIFLLIGALEWLGTLLNLVQQRMMMEQPWIRLIFILGTVIIFTLWSTTVFKKRKLSDFYKTDKISPVAMVSAFFLTFILLSIVQLVVENPMLLVERFLPGLGWVQILAFSFYAAWITEIYLSLRTTSLLRRRIWLLFSIVFFTQLLLGLAGIEKLLMTGKLHLPVPAMIVAGPIFRGAGLFMPILFIVTMILVGPAWCSHLCYIGSWDNFTANTQRRPTELPKWTGKMRLAILAGIILISILLRYLEVSGVVATILGAAFGLIGVGVMVFWSRRQGAMTHCLVYCPIGLLANWLGKLSPFRLKLNENCTECGACTFSCRYNALNKNNIEKKIPASTCTLCGDCVGSCPHQAINYRFISMIPETARYFFVVLVISLHAVFMAVARI